MTTTQDDGGPFALEKLLAFAESKPKKERYNYYDCSSCALAQFVLASGGRFVLSPTTWEGTYEIAGCKYGASDGQSIGPAFRLAIKGRKNFGALAARLRAALAALAARKEPSR